jgi:hypothetical protein
MCFGNVSRKSLIKIPSWQRDVREVISSELDRVDPIIDLATTD